MKKLTILLLLAALLLLTACNDGRTHNTTESTGLIVIAKGTICDRAYRIVYDPDTGVEYYWGADTYLTPLYTADGELKIYQPKGD